MVFISKLSVLFGHGLDKWLDQILYNTMNYQTNCRLLVYLYTKIPSAAEFYSTFVL